MAIIFCNFNCGMKVNDRNFNFQADMVQFKTEMDMSGMSGIGQFPGITPTAPRGRGRGTRGKRKSAPGESPAKKRGRGKSPSAAQGSALVHPSGLVPGPALVQGKWTSILPPKGQGLPFILKPPSHVYSIKPEQRRCKICSKQFKLVSILRAHMRVKHFHRSYDHKLQQHLKWLNQSYKVTKQAKDISQILGLSPAKGPKNVFKCRRSQKTFPLWTKWRIYERKKLLRNMKCRLCPAVFHRPADLLYHKHKAHKKKLVLKKR